jgi:hypothetical protein
MRVGLQGMASHVFQARIMNHSEKRVSTGGYAAKDVTAATTLTFASQHRCSPAGVFDKAAPKKLLQVGYIRVI